MQIKFILILLLTLTIYASERPKIGLVLSGGGARGGAHLGVIQEFEKHNIPIDGIVGTSMGAFIGGLYASGMSSKEIEIMLIETEWDKIIALNYDRTKIPFRRKTLQRDFPGEVKVGINSKNDVVIGRGLFKRQMMLQYLKKRTLQTSSITNFNNFRIPFRAVASNLKNGNKVILRSGSLAESIYASIAIPGGFDPIVIDGTTLVDGGVSDNLPLDVMRDEMNMDIIVVIDISTPFEEDPRFDNILSVLGQLSNILMRKNVEQTIASIKENEILITPDLKQYTPLDSDKYPEIIKIGQEATLKAYPSKLASLSLSDSDYGDYIKNMKQPKVYVYPIIDKIEIDNRTYISDETIRAYLNIEIGKKVDFEQLDMDIKEIYNLMIFDDVTYNIFTEDGITTLKITTTPSWDVNGQIKFAFGFEDDFSGNNDYSVKLEYIMFGLNSYSGEWRTRLSIGIEQLIYTELYQPLDSAQKWYVRPNLFYRDKKVYLSPNILGKHNIDADLDESIAVQAKEYGAYLGFGMNITSDIQTEFGVISKIVKPSIDMVIYEDDSYHFIQNSAEQDILQLRAHLKLDTLDNAYFPKTGYDGELKLSRQMPEWGSDADYSQLFAQISSAYSIGYHTILPLFKIGKTFQTDDFDTSQDFLAFYTLGGLFNLSGLPTNAISGDHMMFGSLQYRYRLTANDFFGALSTPLYTGFSLEMGDAWYEEYHDEGKDFMFASSAYLSADTVIGPLYLGLGVADGRYYSVYFSLGEDF